MAPKHRNFSGTCKNCGHNGDQHFGYYFNKVLCWDESGKCFCHVFEVSNVMNLSNKTHVKSNGR